jgi:carboxyl-terminal processing protease
MQRHGGTVMWLILVLLLGVFVGRLPATIAFLSGDDPWHLALRQVESLITSRYVDPVTREKLLTGAIRGMTEALDDPYTEFVPPQDRERFERELTGQFVGIGALVGQRDGLIAIISPIQGSPALAAGLAPGDRILKIDGQSAQGLSIEDAIKRIVGKPGSTVTLSIRRTGPDGKPLELDIPVTRRAIEVNSTTGLHWLVPQQRWQHALDRGNAIAFIHLDQFTPNSARDLEAAIETARTQLGGKLNALILDLRGNPGGLLDQAVAIVNLFLDSGEIVSTRGRGDPGEAYTAAGSAPFANLPLAILIDESSASASEIVAGALQDNNRALVVGSRSFGKGLVQRIEPVPGLPGAQLKLTEQHYYLPSGRMIQRTDDAKTWGVDPSPGFYVPLTDAQRTTLARLRTEVELVRPTSAPQPPTDQAELFTRLRSPSDRWANPDWIATELGDPVLAAALRGTQARLRDNQWPKPDADTTPVADAVRMSEQRSLERLQERLIRDLARVERRLDALATGTATAQAPQRPTSFWADELDLTNGRVTIFDAKGNPVTTLRITGPDLERWLLDAAVTPETPAPSAPAPANP